MSADSFGLVQAVSSFSKEQKENLQKELKLNSGLTFLFVGQMVARKGISELLSV